MFFRSIPYLGLILLLFSCSQDPVTEDVVEVQTVSAEIPEIDTFDYDTLAGMYTGDFGGSDIRIILNYISKTNAVGYNIHRGLQRNISGKVHRSGDSILVELSEPGDHKYDGVFELLFMDNFEAPMGRWISNSGEIAEKAFFLKRIRPSVDRSNWEDPIDASNFSDYVAFANNGFGDFSFEEDGLVTFSYYPEGDSIDWENVASARVEQATEITGNWTVHGSELVLSWQKNEIFPTPIMKYQIDRKEYDLLLTGESDTIFSSMYP